LARLQWYEARHKQWRQNQLFKTDQKQLYQKRGGQEKAKQAVPDATESRKFWSDLWDQPVQHNGNAEWLSQQRTQAKSVPPQPNICITRDAVEQQLKGMANWKAPGHCCGCGGRSADLLQHTTVTCPFVVVWLSRQNRELAVLESYRQRES